MADVLSVIADVLNQDKKQKKEQAKMMREVQKKLKEKDSVEVAEEDGDKEDYMKFFAGKLKKYGVKSPSELSGEDKKKFFNEIETDWTHDSKEEVEVEEKEESLGKRVKARMEAEDEKEDEDPVGDSDEEEDTDVVKDGEPTEDELEKLADLVVQKIKDKADDEEEEEEEPDATEAESGKEEKIDINPKMEQVLNPHARNKWEEALRQVYAKEAYTDLRGDGDEGTTTSDTDKDYGLHQFSDPKYVPAYTDQSFQTAPDNTGIGQTPKPTQSGTPNKAVGKATAAKTPAKVDAKTGQEKPAVGTKSDTPDKAIGKADSAKIAPRVTTKDGVATQKEEVELDEKFNKKKFDDNEDKNDHTGNGVELVNMFGTTSEKKTMAQIQKNHDKNGEISRKDQSTRDAMVKKYYPKLEEVEIEEKIEKESYGSFITAAAKAKKEGKKTFMMGGKKYPVTIKQKISAAYEEAEVEEAKLYAAKGTAYPATIDTLKMIVREKQNQTVMFKSGKAIVDLFTASAMVQVYDALKKPEMKKTFEKMIGDKAGFLKTQAFAMKMISGGK